VSTERALVTGASHGLGLALATRLAAEGHTVTGVGSRPASEIGEVPFGYVQADLARPDTHAGIVTELGGAVDLVVHSAVRYSPAGRAPTFTEHEEILRVNALAPYHLTLGLLAAQPEDRPCTVVMVNSESMFHADRDAAPYAASKAALRLLTAGLAEACRSRPIAVATLLLGPLDDDQKQADLRRVAEKLNLPLADVTRRFLRKSNPDLVIDHLIAYEACLRSIRYIADLGRTANGMVLRLDGGSAGSLI
jgi:NAD(P)-dependent dehydrogenase (short-subunit alcohol dehydrogenase family)